MNVKQATLLAQAMANENNKAFVIYKCARGLYKIMRYDYYRKAKKERYTTKISPEI